MASRPSEPVASAPAEKVDLTLWHNYGVEANAKVAEALVAAYEAANPNVNIELGQPAGRQLLRVAQRGRHR